MTTFVFTMIIMVILSFIFCVILGISFFKMARRVSALEDIEKARKEELALVHAEQNITEHAINSSVVAERVHLLANQHYFSALIDALEKAILAAGYQFTTDSELSSIADLKEFSHSESNKNIARDLAIARCRYLSPLESDSSIDSSVIQQLEDGYAQFWVEVLLFGLVANGFYVTGGVQLGQGQDVLAGDAALAIG